LRPWPAKYFAAEKCGIRVKHLPESLRLLVILALVAGAIYGGLWALSTFPPEQNDIVKELPSDKLKQ
jgi:hypothetical protein